MLARGYYILFRSPNFSGKWLDKEARDDYISVNRKVVTSKLLQVSTSARYYPVAVFPACYL